MKSSLSRSLDIVYVGVLAAIIIDGCRIHSNATYVIKYKKKFYKDDVLIKTIEKSKTITRREYIKFGFNKLFRKPERFNQYSSLFGIDESEFRENNTKMSFKRVIEYQ